ncbi:hypothetical protein H8356DRAFT_1342226 [Neocallimastix lanati (nom. inval.)]|nr:hypothetical protein H8356DRAFT_1342226 [Neocallimastix sp. JGI-2020a]
MTVLAQLHQAHRTGVLIMTFLASSTKRENLEYSKSIESGPNVFYWGSRFYGTSIDNTKLMLIRVNVINANHVPNILNISNLNSQDPITHSNIEKIFILDSIEYFNMIFIKPLFLCFSGNVDPQTLLNKLHPRINIYFMYPVIKNKNFILRGSRCHGILMENREYETTLYPARSGYRLDARIAKAAKNNRSDVHWLIDCPFFSHIRINNDNSNSNNSNSNNSYSNNSYSNNIFFSNASDSIENYVYVDSSLCEKVIYFIFKCQMKSGAYSDTPFLVVTAALLQSIILIAIGQQWSLFNRFKLNRTTYYQEHRPASAKTNEDHNFYNNAFVKSKINYYTILQYNNALVKSYRYIN